MSWVMSINAATVHLSVTKSMNQHTNFPSTSSHTSCFRVFFSAYYLRVQILTKPQVWKDVSVKQQQKTTSMTITEIVVLKKSSKDRSRFFLESVGPYFSLNKKDIFSSSKNPLKPVKSPPHESQKATCCKKKLMVKTTWHNFLCQRVQHLPYVPKTLFSSPNLNKTCFVKSSKSSSTFFWDEKKITKTLGKPYPNRSK